MNEILRAEKISKYYGSEPNKITVLDGLDFSMEKGSFVAILGKSGSGKTTLLRILSGLDKPSEGKVFLKDEEIHRLNDEARAKLRRSQIGFIFQNFNLLPELTVEENIKLPLFFDKASPPAEHINYLMELLGISDQAVKLPSQLSGGEQQRVAIARAFACRPSIVFADEPTGNLDNSTSEEVLHLFLLSRKQLKQTLLLVTHDLELPTCGSYSYPEKRNAVGGSRASL